MDQVFTTAATRSAAILADGTIGTFRSETPLPEQRWAAAAIYNGFVFAAGGHGAGSIHTNVWSSRIAVDGILEPWVERSPLPVAVQSPSLTAVNGWLLSIGGWKCFNGCATDEVYKAPINADGSVGQWSSAGTLPSPAYNVATAVWNGRLYATGDGPGPYDGQAALWAADVGADGHVSPFSTMTALPGAFIRKAVVATHGYLLLAPGGQDGAKTSRVLTAPILADGRIGDWRETTPTSGVERWGSRLVEHEGRAYLVGGNWTTAITMAPLDQNGALGTWRRQTDLPAARRAVQALWRNGYVYVVGGANGGGGYQTDVLRARVEDDGSLSTPWEQVGTLGEGAWSQMQILVDGGLVVAGGNQPYPGVSNRVWQADFTPDDKLGTFARAPDLPEANSAAVLVRRGPRLLLAGGYRYLGVCLSAVFSATVPNDGLSGDARPGAWNSAGTLPRITSFATGFLRGAELYLIGGDDCSGVAFSDSLRAPVDGPMQPTDWVQSVALPSRLATHATVLAGGRAYMFGGSTAEGIETDAVWLSADGADGLPMG